MVNIIRCLSSYTWLFYELRCCPRVLAVVAPFAVLVSRSLLLIALAVRQNLALTRVNIVFGQEPLLLFNSVEVLKNKRADYW